MRYPPRLGHLATRPVVVNRLVPTYAKAHNIDEQEASDRLSRALAGQLWEDLLAATWEAMKGRVKRLDEQRLLDKVFNTLEDRPLRYGRAVDTNPAWSAFMMMLDLEIGTAGDAARRVMESEQGRKMMTAGLAEAGMFLATELTKGK